MALYNPSVECFTKNIFKWFVFSEIKLLIPKSGSHFNIFQNLEFIQYKFFSMLRVYFLNSNSSNFNVRRLAIYTCQMSQQTSFFKDASYFLN